MILSWATQWASLPTDPVPKHISVPLQAKTTTDWPIGHPKFLAGSVYARAMCLLPQAKRKCSSGTFSSATITLDFTETSFRS